MIGFKKVPTKLVLSAFFISIFFILLLYTDTVLNKPLPEEEIKITKNELESANKKVNQDLDKLGFGSLL